MTIEIFTGVPGAGKTYLAVKRLADRYYDYSRNDELWTIKEKYQDYTIFTNINSLSLPGVKDLPTIWQEQGLTFDQFFHKSFQDKIHQKYKKIIYVIDECQQYIPPRFANKDVILYFDTHRHYGDHIILITQDLAKITRSVSTLCELEYRAVRRTMSIAGEFKYNIRSSGEIFKREACKPDKKIFALYKSFEGNDMQKVRNNLKYYIVALTLAFCWLTYYFYNHSIFSSGSKEETLAQLQNPETNISREIQFVSENQSEPEPEQKFYSYRLRNFIAAEDNSLLMFLDPITGDIIDYHNNPYQIKFYPPNSYYLILSSDLYHKIPPPSP